MTGNPSLEGLQGCYCDNGLQQLVPEMYCQLKEGAPVRQQIAHGVSSYIDGWMEKYCDWDVDKAICDPVHHQLLCLHVPLQYAFPSEVVIMSDTLLVVR